MWWCGVLQRWCVEELKLNKPVTTNPVQNEFVFLGFIIIRLNHSVLYFLLPFRLPMYCREMARWDGMGWRDGSWMMMIDEIVNRMDFFNE